MHRPPESDHDSSLSCRNRLRSQHWGKDTLIAATSCMQSVAEKGRSYRHSLLIAIAAVYGSQFSSEESTFKTCFFCRWSVESESTHLIFLNGTLRQFTYLPQAKHARYRTLCVWSVNSNQFSKFWNQHQSLLLKIGHQHTFATKVAFPVISCCKQIWKILNLIVSFDRY